MVLFFFFLVKKSKLEPFTQPAWMHTNHEEREMKIKSEVGPATGSWWDESVEGPAQIKSGPRYSPHSWTVYTVAHRITSVKLRVD